MKIAKIKFIKYGLFKDYEVVFDNEKIPRIIILVGNNGSGKTSILEAIFGFLSGSNAHFPTDGTDNSEKDGFEIKFSLQLNEDEKSNLIKHNLNNPNINISDNSQIECALTNNNFVSIRSAFEKVTRVTYSSVEINFSSNSISTIGLRDVDKKKLPQEKSENLSSEIPQLLVDIKAADDAENSQWHKDNPTLSYQDKPSHIGSRIARFTNAFDRIFDGSKRFKEIKNIRNNKNIIFVDDKGEERTLKQLSTGEKQIIYRVSYLLKNLKNLDGGIILIDEPEISLHPIWQSKFKDFLLEIFKDLDVQIIIATHSPYIFKNLKENEEVCIKIDSTLQSSEKISLILKGSSLSPTMNLVNYIAFGIPSEALHIELYSQLQIMIGDDSIKKIENWLQDPKRVNISRIKTFTRTKKFYSELIGTSVSETLPTFIRNAIHHSDETGRVYSEEDLRQSIDIMIGLLQ
jgi:predicted ATP-binding protein involved in virulence